MSILILLVVVPLSLRYLASWKMRQMRVVLLQQEKEARALMARYEELTEELTEVELVVVQLVWIMEMEEELTEALVLASQLSQLHEQMSSLFFYLQACL